MDRLRVVHLDQTFCDWAIRGAEVEVACGACQLPVAFHRADGSGYTLLKDAVITLNGINPQIAARMLTPMREWKRYTEDRQNKMKAALQEIANTEKLSPDVFEIVSKSLKG